MAGSSILRRAAYVAMVITGFASIGAVAAEDPFVAAMAVKIPKDIKWVENTKAGSAQAIMVGDPAKPGLYIVLTKWHAGHMSRPHFHPNDRFITVLSGTWWVGAGTKYDPASTRPVPTGSFVTHFGKGIHYDGAKDEDVVLEILGEGPATSTPAEVK
jgi:hypothetical protein